MRLGIQLFVLLVSLSVSSAWAIWPLQDSEGRDIPSLAPLLEQVNPSVVNISTYANSHAASAQFNGFFQRGPAAPKTPIRRARSAGSGVIIDASEGIVISNHHVVKQADEIHVSLNDGRSYRAELLGVDPEVDIAVLKLKGYENLKAIKLADSDQIKQGDFVVAIGNPFGLGHTATQGIISAVGRSGLGLESFENFIQTDASINPGNSGGALINLIGQLIGINTAIFSPAGGNVGIGFAIPVNMARASVEQILLHGEVRRGMLGVVIQDLTPEMAEALDVDNIRNGVIIADIQPGSAAEQAGLKIGDVLTALDGKALASSTQLRNWIGQRRVGDAVMLSIIRGGDSQQLSVVISDPLQLASKSTQSHPLFEGIEFEDAVDVEGLRVIAIENGSAGALTGLQPGDILLSYNRIPINKMEDLDEAAQSLANRVVLRVRRGDIGLYIVIQ